MTSIPHIGDLPPRTLLRLVHGSWTISEKLDGSSFEFGLDDDGRFFSKRKGAPACYSIDEWPLECWASTYRMAHHCAGSLIAELISQDLIDKGHKFQAEIIHGTMPNTIPYTLGAGESARIVIIGSNVEISTDVEIILRSFSVMSPPGALFTLDGRNPQTYCLEWNWKFSILSKFSEYNANLFHPISVLESNLKQFLFRKSNITGLTALDVMEASLAKKHPMTGDRKWAELKEEIKTEKALLKESYDDILYDFIRSVFESFTRQGIGSVKSTTGLQEGFVVQADDVTFKIVNREVFPDLNLFTHRVKYWIVGGRRPARSSFLSRTKDWPKAERLARLDMLLERYLKHHTKLTKEIHLLRKKWSIRYDGSLHLRTLGMFYDTRKRIENGR